MTFESWRYQAPSSNSMAGRKCCPVCSITTVRLPRGNVGSLTISYSIPCSSSAFWTVQQGWATLNQTNLQRWSLTTIRDLLPSFAVVTLRGHDGESYV